MYNIKYINKSGLNVCSVKNILLSILVSRCLARLTLLYRYNEHIVQSPSVAPLKRAEINNPTFQAPPEGFRLKSGRVIRTVDAGE